MNEQYLGKIFEPLNEKIGEEHTSTLKTAFFNAISNTRVNLLIVGATGVGKSTTIKAIFDTHGTKERQNIEIKSGGKPVTMDIANYRIDDNLTIYDSPGLGDGGQDTTHTQKIQKLLTTRDENGNALIDLVLVIIDASVERDLESTFKTIKVIGQALAEEDRDRILIALNKCDRGSSHPKAKWDYEAGKPNDFLKLALDKKVTEIQYRILETTGLKIEPIPYTAGFYDEDEDKQYKSYNLDKIIATAFNKLKGKDPRKVISLQKNINEEAFQGSNDGLENYREKTDNSFFNAVESVVDMVAKKVLPEHVYAVGKLIWSGLKSLFGW